MINNGSAETEGERSPWTQPGFIASAVVVALLVVLGIVLSVTGGSSKPDTGAATPPATGGTAGGTASRDSDSVCGLPSGDRSIPSEAPSAKWKLRGAVAVPTAPEIGPGRFRGGVPACFAHSPTGALFAMVNIHAAMGQFARQPGRYPIRKVVKMIAPGPGRRTLEAAAAKAPVADKGSTKPGAQVAGFTIVRYEADTAVIDLAFRGDRPDVAGYTHGQSTLRWQDGDWKLVLAQNGSPFDAVQAIPDLTAYVPWGVS